jgi:hypothetical protein
VTKWALATLGAFILLGVLGVTTARFFGKSGSKLSIQISVAAHWFAAYVLWSFTAGLAAKYRIIGEYEAGWFALFALIAGYVHYRARLAGDAERGLAVFVAAQLVWLFVILYRNGLLIP